MGKTIREILTGAINYGRSMENERIKPQKYPMMTFDEAEAEILQWVSEVIGEDEDPMNNPAAMEILSAENNLRAEQRKRAGLK